MTAAESIGRRMTLSPVGHGDDGIQTVEVDLDDEVIGSLMLELVRRGDDEHGWLDLLAGPGGVVEVPHPEFPGAWWQFRVVRVVGWPSGATFDLAPV